MEPRRILVRYGITQTIASNRKDGVLLGYDVGMNPALSRVEWIFEHDAIAEVGIWSFQHNEQSHDISKKWRCIRRACLRAHALMSAPHHVRRGFYRFYLLPERYGTVYKKNPSSSATKWPRSFETTLLKSPRYTPESRANPFHNFEHLHPSSSKEAQGLWCVWCLERRVGYLNYA